MNVIRWGRAVNLALEDRLVVIQVISASGCKNLASPQLENESAA